MPCEQCEARRQRMKAFVAAKLETARHWAQVRLGQADAAPSEPAPTVEQAAPTAGQRTRARRTAANPRPAHGQRGMAEDPAAGTDP